MRTQPAESAQHAPDQAPPEASPVAPPSSMPRGMGPLQGMALGMQSSAGNALASRVLAGGRPGGGAAAARMRGPVAAAGGGTLAREPATAAPPAPAPASGESSGLEYLPDFVLDSIREIPGYQLLSQLSEEDLMTGHPVTVSRQSLVESLLGHGPFAAGVAPVLAAMDIFDEVFTYVSEQLSAHRLTTARIGQDISAAWEQVSITNTPGTNLEIVEGYIDAVIADVVAFVEAVGGRLIEMVREAAVEVAEPLLEKPEIAPAWNLAKKVMHYDPLRGESVDAPTVEILADFMRVIKQEERLAQMQQEGTLQKTADWLDMQFDTFAELVTQLTSLFSDAWAAISPANLPNLLSTLPQLAERGFALFGRVVAFGQTVIGQVLVIIKDAVLGQLSQHAHKVPGFHLMTVILGRNPFTGVAVPRTAENLIHGFITLMPNGEETYAQLAESGVIAEAAARIESVMTRLGITWELITGTFLAIWDGISLDDLLHPIDAFERIVGQFGEPLKKIADFVIEVVETVVSLILKLMNFPSDLLESIIANAKAAMGEIKKDPVGFLKNLLAALKEGVTGFFGNVATYLKNGLAGWLLRGLGALGIKLPDDFSIGSILKTVGEVLGVTIEKLWAKLAKKLGPEKVDKLRGGIDKLEGAWEFIKEIQEGGIGAIWKHVTDKLSSLWETLLTSAKDWIQTQIIDAAIARILSMLDPTGIMAVVRSFQAFFNAIQSAVEYLRDILGIVNDYVSTLAQVAAGNISAGAKKLENGLANAIPVALGFLANQAGIGDIPEKVVEIINGLREKVDEGLDWLLDKAMALGEKALAALGIGGKDEESKDGDDKDDDEPEVEAGFAEGSEGHTLKVEKGPDGQPALMVHSTPSTLEKYLTYLEQQLSEGPAGDEGRKLLADIRAQLGSLVPEVRSFWSSVRKIAKGAKRKATGSVEDRIKGLAARLAELTKSATSDTDPHASAPGVGKRGLHGKKPPSLRNGHRLHWLESEHILPYAIVADVWEIMGLGAVKRKDGLGRYIDQQQATVMLYEGAAEHKTTGGGGGDGAAIRAFETYAAGKKAALKALPADAPDQDRYAVLGEVDERVAQERDQAVQRTITAVELESKTNGRRRLPKNAAADETETPIPSDAIIKEAVQAQWNSLVSLFHEVMYPKND